MIPTAETIEPRGTAGTRSDLGPAPGAPERLGPAAGTQSDLGFAPGTAGGSQVVPGPAPGDAERGGPQTAIERFALPIVVGFAVLAAALWRWRVGLGNYPLDDAYIVEHSVLGILGDGETRFLDSSSWTGVTSPVYVLLLLPLAAILPMDVAHFVLEAAAITAFAVGCLSLCRALGVRSWMQVALPVLALTVGEVPLQLANGLETGLAMAAIAWLLVAFVRGFPSWGFALAGISPFIRPELAALAGMWGLGAIVGLRRVGRKRSTPSEAMSGANPPHEAPADTTPAGTTPAPIRVVFQRPLVRGIALAVGSCAAVAGVVVAGGGAVFTGTVSAKASFFAEGCQPLLDKVGTSSRALARFAIALGPFVVGFALVALSKFRVAAFVFVGAMIAMFTLRLPGALHHNNSRYLYVLVPLAVGGWAAACAHDSERVRRAAATALGATALIAAVSLPTRFVAQTDETVAASQSYGAVADWVATNVDDDAVVLLHDAGAMSLVGRQPLVDLVGLKTSTSPAVHRAYTEAQCRRGTEATSLIAARYGASVLVVTSRWDREFEITESLRDEGWTVERIDTRSGTEGPTVAADSRTPGDRDDSQGLERYEVYSIAPPRD